MKHWNTLRESYFCVHRNHHNLRDLRNLAAKWRMNLLTWGILMLFTKTRYSAICFCWLWRSISDRACNYFTPVPSVMLLLHCFVSVCLFSSIRVVIGLKILCPKFIKGFLALFTSRVVYSGLWLDHLVENVCSDWLKEAFWFYRHSFVNQAPVSQSKCPETFRANFRCYNSLFIFAIPRF